MLAVANAQELKLASQPASERHKLRSLSAPGVVPKRQADRPRCARAIRGRIGLALDCRSGPGPRTARCRARSSSSGHCEP